jgi:hypothetical protein
MDQMSDVDVVVIASAEQPTGIGELAMPVFAATVHVCVNCRCGL